MLTKVDPSEVQGDPLLQEALQEAQLAFSALLEVAPSPDDLDNSGYSLLPEFDYDEEDDDSDQVLDLLDEMHFDPDEEY